LVLMAGVASSFKTLPQRRLSTAARLVLHCSSFWSGTLFQASKQESHSIGRYLFYITFSNITSHPTIETPALDCTGGGTRACGTQ